MLTFIAVILLLGYFFDWCVCHDRRDGRYGKMVINTLFFSLVMTLIYVCVRTVYEIIFDDGDIWSILLAAAIILVFLFLKNLPPRKWAR